MHRLAVASNDRGCREFTSPGNTEFTITTDIVAAAAVPVIAIGIHFDIMTNRRRIVHSRSTRPLITISARATVIAARPAVRRIIVGMHHLATARNYRGFREFAPPGHTEFAIRTHIAATTAVIVIRIRIYLLAIANGGRIVNCRGAFTFITIFTRATVVVTAAAVRRVEIRPDFCAMTNCRRIRGDIGTFPPVAVLPRAAVIAA